MLPGSPFISLNTFDDIIFRHFVQFSCLIERFSVDGEHVGDVARENLFERDFLLDGSHLGGVVRHRHDHEHEPQEGSQGGDGVQAAAQLEPEAELVQDGEPGAHLS